MSKKGEYEVELIVGKRVNNNNETEYLVVWVGYDDPNDYTWEPAANLSNCKQVRVFEQQQAYIKFNTSIQSKVMKPFSKVVEEQVPTDIRRGRQSLGKSEREIETKVMKRQTSVRSKYEVENFNQFGSGNRGRYIFEGICLKNKNQYFKVNAGGQRKLLSKKELQDEDPLTLLYFYRNQAKFSPYM